MQEKHREKVKINQLSFRLYQKNIENYNFSPRLWNKKLKNGIAIRCFLYIWPKNILILKKCFWGGF